MTSRVSILFLASLTLSAQALRDVAPLKYWPAPLYWQPTHAEARATTRSELFNVKDNAQPPAQTPANALVFVAMTPCRLVDTRAGFGFTGAFGPPSLTGGATRAFPLQTSTTCSIPTTAQAYSLNITIVPPGQMFYLTIWPLGATQPNVSTQNDLLGTVIANAAIVPAGNDAGSGSVNVFVSNNTDLIIDINGYYAPQSGITLSQGTAAAPSMSFAGDAGTGIFSSGAGMLNASVAGTQSLSIGGANNNTGVGVGTLGADTTGFHDTAVGYYALSSVTTGCCNSAVGWQALGLNTTGSGNTAVGGLALSANTTANANSAFGGSALQNNTTGCCNTAVGQFALLNNTTASNNTAVGQNALNANTTGCNNAAFGQNALSVNTTACGNSAFGAGALAANTGTENVAVGTGALGALTGGVGDIAIGWGALGAATSGNNNIAIGTQAAHNVTGNHDNIHIGSQGSSADVQTIRIGTPATQLSFFAAGIRGVTTGNNDAVPVVIDSNGQLGTVSSSIRFKEDVHDMADASSRLLQLRPVTYRYKQPYADGSKPVDYGLIAEEVAEVYPDLVVKNADGQVETVQYQKLTPLLLNELQKLHQQALHQQELNEQLQARLAALEAQQAAGFK